MNIEEPGSYTKWRRQLLSALLFCIIGSLINIAGSSIAVRFDLPIFLDSIGTILTAAFGGYLPGIAVGYITNIINGISDITNAYYAVINILLALAAAFFERHGFFKNVFKTVIAVIAFALIGGGLGSILTYCLYGFDMGEGISRDLTEYINANLINNIFFAQLFADLCIDFVDKAITVTIVIMIMRFIPQKLRPLIHFYGWRQAPIRNSEEILSDTTHKTRGLSLQHKILLILSVAIVFIAVSTAGMCFILFHNTIIDEHSSTCKSITSLAATEVDGDKVDEYIKKGTSSKDYLEVKSRLQKIKDSSPNIKYLYIYKIEEDGCHVVFDLDGTDTDGNIIEGSPAGEIVPFDPTFEPYLKSLLNGETIPPIISDDSYGWLLTVYQPIYKSNGECACYAAADISMHQETLDEISFLAKCVSLFFAFFILILAIGMWLARYNVILPINTMSLAAEDFAFTTKNEREESVKRFNNLDIRTGDEIERLYTSFAKTIADTNGYIVDIQNQSNVIGKMQNGLIMVLADIVESRDKCTGDHIKKTAAYVKIIIDQLRKNGDYLDILTDEYRDNVVHSAPLHDIGKIKVPDSILNKPGKLTDEEFEVMKQHTTAGKEIIEDAITLVDESGYLSEAKDLAAYHHEKWNGKGYPEGLAGEDIPLSARIMAVADVFDALLSKRSYKEPFTFEKALSIIEEGSGTHFEPTIVKAFVDARDEVRKIAEMNMSKEYRF
ncbi:MAG: HD domain-containing protein [Firmicutes bacterium]|nr:HD domain-containing protein [Bacillota bacterium]